MRACAGDGLHAAPADSTIVLITRASPSADGAALGTGVTLDRQKHEKPCVLVCPSNLILLMDLGFLCVTIHSISNSNVTKLARHELKICSFRVALVELAIKAYKYK